MTTGRKSKMYIDIAGAGVGTWVEVTPVGDVDMPDSKNVEAINTRESPFQKNAEGQRVVELSFNLKIKNGNANFEALRDAYEAGDVIGVANYIGDMADVGAQGMHMDCIISEMPKTIPLEGYANSNIKLVPAYDSDFEPVLMETAL
ncbi:hypothetical protein [Gimesia sp.]|uniref:hypothetical protein n=1 Tax=Gimesia sp. TaxID=2024833 RepID=UPI003A8D4B53